MAESGRSEGEDEAKLTLHATSLGLGRFLSSEEKENNANAINAVSIGAFFISSRIN
jgi:hypothetical protein